MKLDFTSDINKEYADEMNYPQADRFVVKVQWWTFVALALQTFFASAVKISQYYPSPFSLWVISLPEAAVTIILGLLAAVIPTLLIGKLKNHYIWRIIVTFTL